MSLDGRALCWQLQGILHHHSILHHWHHPPSLKISSASTPGLLRTPSALTGRQSTKVSWPLAIGNFLLYPKLLSLFAQNQGLVVSRTEANIAQTILIWEKIKKKKKMKKYLIIFITKFRRNFNRDFHQVPECRVSQLVSKESDIVCLEYPLLRWLVSNYSVNLWQCNLFFPAYQKFQPLKFWDIACLSQDYYCGVHCCNSSACLTGWIWCKHPVVQRFLLVRFGRSDAAVQS